MLDFNNLPSPDKLYYLDKESGIMSYYVISSGSYSDYNISFIISSPNVITEEDFKKYHLQSIKRSLNFEDTQIEKIRKHIERVEIDFPKDIKSLNYYNVFRKNNPIEISYENWRQLLKDAGVEDNPRNWFEQILTEHGCEVIEYEEFNTDDWD